jgi:hypothetical protein
MQRFRADPLFCGYAQDPFKDGVVADTRIIKPADLKIFNKSGHSSGMIDVSVGQNQTIQFHDPLVPKISAYNGLSYVQSIVAFGLK